MLRSIRQNQTGNRTAGKAPLRRPGAAPLRERSGSDRGFHARIKGGQHPLCRSDENERLSSYEDEVKNAFDNIVPTLKLISSMQHETDFEARAQRIALEELGFELPKDILADAWVNQMDLRRCFAWCVFQTYRHFCDEFFGMKPTGAAEEFESFLQSCGFHSMDISPCADGRLAHLVRHVLRLSPRAVRRKSYAGAMFDVEDSIQKWEEVELKRFREGKPNSADASTRYLKVAAYHHSSGDPEHEGCAAHGSDTRKASQAALDRLINFRKGIENSYCCGASIDLLLVGIDTDTDAIRIHVPDAEGNMDLDAYVDAQALYEQTMNMNSTQASSTIEEAVKDCTPQVAAGMARLISHLLENNMSQINYVRDRHGERYPDIGHAERFIGAGVGFEDIQLRNLMYFAYLNTVEEGAADMDVGIKIFTGLNVSHGLPVPVVVRFDYHGDVPGARERAEQRCGRVAEALSDRFEDLSNQGLLHILQVARDCDSDGPLEVFACTADTPEVGGH